MSKVSQKAQKSLSTSEAIWLQTASIKIKQSEDFQFRPQVQGKFLFVGSEKLYVKGVTYGAFRPNDQGVEFHDEQKIRRDFAMMAKYGFNVVRIPHTTPPRHVLDLAMENSLKVMVGLSAEQYIGHLIDRNKPRRVLVDEIRKRVDSVAGH